MTGAVYAVWANYMVSELGYSQTAMSALWSLASTSEFPLMILAGWLSDRLGRLPMLSLGFLALQSKKYFEELFHLGSSIYGNMIDMQKKKEVSETPDKH